MLEAITVFLGFTAIALFPFFYLKHALSAVLPSGVTAGWLDAVKVFFGAAITLVVVTTGLFIVGALMELLFLGFALELILTPLEVIPEEVLLGTYVGFLFALSTRLTIPRLSFGTSALVGVVGGALWAGVTALVFFVLLSTGGGMSIQIL